MLFWSVERRAMMDGLRDRGAGIARNRPPVGRRIYASNPTQAGSMHVTRRKSNSITAARAGNRRSKQLRNTLRSADRALPRP